MLIKTLADKLTTEFAALTTGYDFDIIVTDDIQLYDSKMKEGNKNYVPCILTVNTSFKNENQYLEVFQYMLRFALPKKVEYRDTFISVLRAFSDSQTQEVIEGQYVLKTAQYETYTGEDTIKRSRLSIL